MRKIVFAALAAFTLLSARNASAYFDDPSFESTMNSLNAQMMATNTLSSNITQIYTDYLNNPSTDIGGQLVNANQQYVNDQMNRLNAPLFIADPQAQHIAISSFSSSEGDAENDVEQTYETYVGHDADPDGLSYYTQAILSGGMTHDQLAEALSNSPEGQNHLMQLASSSVDLFSVTEHGVPVWTGDFATAKSLNDAARAEGNKTYIGAAPSGAKPTNGLMILGNGELY